MSARRLDQAASGIFGKIEPASAVVPAPLLVVVIDTEEEFDWSRPVARANTAVAATGVQESAQDLFARYDIQPTYVVDYPVATTPSAIDALKDFVDQGVCEIGAHLHPWVNPPHDEEVGAFTSYPGNLPADLEAAKLARLGEAIEAGFGVRPSVYKAGRYGLGPGTAATLARLRFTIDLSVVPRTDFSGDGGPDFSAFDHRPFFFGGGARILELPLSCGFVGAMRRHGRLLYPRLSSRLGNRLHLPAPMARLRLLERIRLTPEGTDLAAQKRLVGSLLRQGCTIFHYTYHSPSLAPGNTPYVRTRRDLDRFLATMDGFFAFFFGEVGGRPATPQEVYRLLAGRGENEPAEDKPAAGNMELSGSHGCWPQPKRPLPSG